MTWIFLPFHFGVIVCVFFGGRDDVEICVSIFDKKIMDGTQTVHMKNHSLSDESTEVLMFTNNTGVQCWLGSPNQWCRGHFWMFGFQT